MAIDPLAPAGLGTYWEDQNLDPADAVLNSTPGLTKDIPYLFLPGSDVPLGDTTNVDAAEALFPTYDGVTAGKILPPPRDPANPGDPDAIDPTFAADFAEDPADLDPDAFLAWHSAYQLQYIQEHYATGTSTAGASFKYVTIGTGDTITAVLSNNGLKVFVVEHLQKRDLAVMSIADQQAVSATTAFTKVPGGVGEALGLTTDITLVLRGDGVDGSPNKLGIDTTIDSIKALFPDTNAQQGLMSKADRDIFISEINNIRGRVVNHQAAYSMTDIMEQVSAVVTRFTRALDFAQVPVESNASSVTGVNDANQYKNVVSMDGGQTIIQGYQVFIAQEKRVLDLDNTRLRIADLGTLQDKSLDVPNLVFLLQLQYNLSDEAKNTADTQEVNQMNALLKTYGAMQQIINQTSKAFDTSNSKDNRTLLGNDGNTFTVASLTSTLSTAQMKVISMFEDFLNGAQHPLEKIQGIARPKDDMYFNSTGILNEYLATHWNTFGTQLSDTVTLLNQDSQIKMNDINSLDKQKTRHFDLANSALQKMSDMISNIARAGN